MHFFVWFRFKSQLFPETKRGRAGYILASFLALTPILAHLVPFSRPYFLVYSIWQLTFIWLGLIFYLFVFQVIMAVIQLLRWPLCRWKWPGLASRTGLLGLTISLSVVSYGFLEASRPPGIAGYETTTSKITRNIRIVFLSDLHIGIQKSAHRLERIVQAAENQQPDLVIFGGDVVNDHLEGMGHKAEILDRLDPLLGKFGVLGNHEFHPGLKQSVNFFRKAGIKILDNEKICLDEQGLCLAGVTDPTGAAQPRLEQEKRIARVLTGLDARRFNILVTHRPWGFDEAAQAGADVQLAGHVHNGQLFPFRLLVRLQFEHVYGLYRQGDSKLIVTSGAGSWGPPIRVLAPAELVVLDLFFEDRKAG